MTPQLLTVTEVAEELRVSPYTVRRWVREGRIVAHRAGENGWIRISRDDLDALRRAA